MAVLSIRASNGSMALRATTRLADGVSRAERRARWLAMRSPTRRRFWAAKFRPAQVGAVHAPQGSKQSEVRQVFDPGVLPFPREGVGVHHLVVVEVVVVENKSLRNPKASRPPRRRDGHVAGGGEHVGQVVKHQRCLVTECAVTFGPKPERHEVLVIATRSRPGRSPGADSSRRAPATPPLARYPRSQTACIYTQHHEPATRRRLAPGRTPAGHPQDTGAPATPRVARIWKTGAKARTCDASRAGRAAARQHTRRSRDGPGNLRQSVPENLPGDAGDGSHRSRLGGLETAARALGGARA